MRRITKIGKKNVKVRVEDWTLLWDMIGRSVRDTTLRGGGGCESFCEQACKKHDGCDLAFGDDPCGALCNDGEVYVSEV